MKRNLIAVIAFAAAASLAMAQGSAPARQGNRPQGGRMRMGGGQMMGMGLVYRPEVQTELKLTAAQKATLAKLRSNMMAKMQPKNGKRPDPKAMGAEMQKAQASIDKLLSAAQKQRLGQLRLQRSGAFALLEPSVAKQLGLTAAQKTKIEAIQKAAFKPPTNGQRPNFNRATLDATKNKMLGVLSAAQKTKWKAMLGKPFTFKNEPGRAVIRK